MNYRSHVSERAQLCVECELFKKVSQNLRMGHTESVSVLVAAGAEQPRGTSALEAWDAS